MSIDPKTLTPAELAFVDAMFPREEMDFRSALKRAEPWIRGRREALAASGPEEIGVGKLLVLARDYYEMLVSCGNTPQAAKWRIPQAAKWRIAIEAAERLEG